ncbi:putative quinol monooxygenase [Dactylosporangium sp. NPDC005572]|uniref:putative quinol monooxygenase n=1 Tax=Dactylosporangium sp. NPDC005572 TaxID=3156889 RepID=UPI0033ACAE97
MFTVIVTLDVHPEHVDEFVDAIGVNARASVRDEPGCLRFDVHRSVDDPYRFVLYEIYTDQDAFYQQHRAAPHYAVWREAAARLVRSGGHVNTFCVPVFPRDIPEGDGHGR